MSVLGPYYRKMDVVVDHLAQAAKQVPSHKITWRPCQKALPWLYLIHHTGTHRQVFLNMLKGEPTNFPDCYAEALRQIASGNETAKYLRESWDELKEFLRNQPDGYAKTTLSPPWGGPEMTVEQLAWWTFEEAVHHRGQAWVYARMNDITPPSIWGTEEVAV